MDKEEVLRKLSISKNRQEIIDAFLITWDHSDLVQTIKALSHNPKEEFMIRFGLNLFQAREILDIKKPIAAIPKESILEEKENLQNIRKKLEEDLKRFNET